MPELRLFEEEEDMAKKKENEVQRDIHISTAENGFIIRRNTWTSLEPGEEFDYDDRPTNETYVAGDAEELLGLLEHLLAA